MVGRMRFTGRLRPGTLARLAHIAFVAFATVMGLRWAGEALPRYLPKDWAQAHEWDGLQDWYAARLYLEGKSPFSPEGLKSMGNTTFGHPPTTSFWFIPLAPLGKPLTAELVAYSTFIFLIIHIYLCVRAVKFPAPIALTALVLAWALTAEGLVWQWHSIQLSEQIALPLVVSWVYLRRGREVPGGIALGIAATIKLFPGVLMLYLFFARRWRAFLAASAVYFGVAAIMTAGYGRKCWWLFLSQQKIVATRWMGSVRNASLQGIVMRLFAPAGVSDPAPTAKTTYVATGIAVTLLLLAWLVSYRATRRAKEHDARAVDVPFALFTVLSVFIGPWIWEHYWVMLIQPAFVVAGIEYWAFHDSVRDWLDEKSPTRLLLWRTAAFALVVAGLGATIKFIGTQHIRVQSLFDNWAATKNPWVHRQLQWYEVFNCLPWLIMIALCFFSARLAAKAIRERSV
jgi:Glycosyltransferase family 87